MPRSPAPRSDRAPARGARRCRATTLPGRVAPARRARRSRPAGRGLQLVRRSRVPRLARASGSVARQAAPASPSDVSSRVRAEVIQGDGCRKVAPFRQGGCLGAVPPCLDDVSQVRVEEPAPASTNASVVRLPVSLVRAAASSAKASAALKSPASVSSQANQEKRKARSLSSPRSVAPAQRTVSRSRASESRPTYRRRRAARALGRVWRGAILSGSSSASARSTALQSTPWPQR